jgi:hypothetical protein
MGAVPFLLAALLCVIGATATGHVDSAAMYRVVVQNAAARRALANDGTPAIFYHRAAAVPTAKWLVFLQGGDACVNAATCLTRWEDARFLMTTNDAKHYPPVRTDWHTNFCSNNASRSPFYDFNIAFVPYVTSDVWVGNASRADIKKTGMPWQFNGRAVVTAVVEDLFNGFRGPKTNATVRVPPNTSFVLSGGSAGGLGVVNSADYVGGMVSSLCPSCTYSAIADSGVFVSSDIKIPKRTIANCDNAGTCPVPDMLALGMILWRAVPNLNANCLAHYWKAGKPTYNCARSSVAVEYIQSRIMYVGYMFDFIDFSTDVGCPSAKSCMAFPKFTAELTAVKRRMFAGRSAFVPSCFGHVIETDVTIAVRGVTLLAAVRAWYYGGSNATTVDSCHTLGCRVCPLWHP